MRHLSKYYLPIFLIGFLALSAGGWGSNLEVDEGDLEAQDQNRRQQIGYDVGFQNYRWDIKSAQRGYIFYSVTGEVLSITSTVGLAVTTVLSAVAGMQAGPEEDQDGSGWAIAATVCGSISLACKTLATAAGKAADSRKKQVNKLRKEAINNDNNNEEL